MTLPVRVRRRAELDVDEAYAWYEALAEGLGEGFLRAVEACFARIVRHPRRTSWRTAVCTGHGFTASPTASTT